MSSKKETSPSAPVIVTGATSGIGLATAGHLLQAGYSVIGIGRDFSKCSLESDRFRKEIIDFSEPQQAAEQFAQLLKSIDGEIRALVNNAGVGRMGHLEQLSQENILETFNVNVLAHVLITRLLLPRLKSQAVQSDILFIGSEAALKGAQQGSIYCASKFAIRGFSQALQEECANSRVRVSLINPGAVRTPFFNELQFEPGPDPSNAIDAQEIAELLLDVLQLRPGTVIDEINLSPRKRVWQHKS